MIEIRNIPCKTALSTSRLPGLEYSLNPYRGCQHNCAYCYVPNVLRIPRTSWGCFVDAKTNIPTILAKELKNKKPGVVGISTVTDPYQPLEKTHKLTRYCLEQLLRFNFPICIQTKSSLIQRDLDLLANFSHCEIMISIGTLNDTLRNIMEPHTSSISQRLDTIKKCTNHGIKTNVFFGPIYPDITKESIPTILETFADAGVSEVMVDALNTKPGIVSEIEHRVLQYSPVNISCFTHWLSSQDEWFKIIRDDLHRLGEQYTLKVIDAF